MSCRRHIRQRLYLLSHGYGTNAAAPVTRKDKRMTLAEIARKTSGSVEIDVQGAEASCAYVGDLLSDVMGHAGEDSVLITVQNHLNTIAVCTLVGIRVIVVCHGRPIPPDMAEAAKREEVAIVVTSLSQYAAALALSDLPPCER